MDESVKTLSQKADYLHFINEGYRNCKVLAFAKDAEGLAERSFIKKDKGVIFESKDTLTADFRVVMKVHPVWPVWERKKIKKGTFLIQQIVLQ